MTGSVGALARSGLVALVSLLTTWLAMVSWMPFTERNDFVGPLLALALTITVLGTLSRALLRSGVLGWMVTTVVVAVAVFFLVPAAFPGIGSTDAGPWVDWTRSLELARESAQVYAAPVPDTVPTIAPLMVLGGAVALVVTDLVTNTLRWVVPGGLVLLTVATVPVAVTGEPINWAVFAGICLGYLTVILLHQGESLHAWGRGTGRRVTPTSPDSAEITSNASGRSWSLAATMGGVSVAGALAVTVLVPLPGTGLVAGSGWGSLGQAGGSGALEVTNPSVDLRRDLERGTDRPLLRVVTDDPDPSYLRLGTLNSFNGAAWTPGDREVDVPADGTFPPIQGLAEDTPGRTYNYAVEVLPKLRSDWLPVMPSTVRARTSTAWTVDPSTLDVFHGNDEDATTATEGSYSFTAVDPEFSEAQLRNATAQAGSVPSTFLQLPGDVPNEVARYAREATRDAVTDFEKAQALQNWFRNSGGFTYSLERAPVGSGNGTIERFLEERVGYCEQFAATMAVMARKLGMPSRVAVGWLNPDIIDEGTFEYSSYDAHAWTEIYFEGTGWVAFEPTPSTRASRVPSYTDESTGPSAAPSPSESTSTSASASPSASSSAPESIEPSASASATDSTASSEDTGSSVPVGPILWTLAALLVLAALAALPQLVRRARRNRRWGSGDPESAWAELVDTARDLGLDPPGGRSLRETGSWLLDRVAAPAETRTGASHLVGAQAAPEAAAEIEALVLALESIRYAPVGGSAVAQGSGWTWPEAAMAALAHGVTSTARTRARWLPRTLLPST